MIWYQLYVRSAYVRRETNFETGRCLMFIQQGGSIVQH